VKVRLPIVVVMFFLLILILPFFVSQVESGTSTNTYYPSNYNLSGSTQLVSGSLGNLQSDDGNYMTFRSYPNYDFKFGESLGESSWNTNTEYQDKVVLTFTPPTSADYIVIATAEVQGNCISPPDVKARLIIGASTCQELIYRVKDTTDWYPFCALKRVNLPASSQTLKIQYAISETTATAKIRNARLYAFSLSGQYAESEAESSWSTNTNWQDKVALTFTPSTSGDYLIIATANYGGSSTDYSTLLQFLKDGSVQVGPTRETSASEARYTFGVMRKINLDATSHTFKIQYKTENTLNTAHISYAHIVAIRIDQFSNTYYAESEVESGPAAANTWYNKVTNTYTAQAADHLIIGSILYKAGSTSSSVGLKLVQGADVDQSPLVEHKDSTDYEGCFMMAKASLSAGSVTDKIQYMGESTSARVKNARLISLQLPIQHTVEVEFTGSSNTLDWTQLAWVVDSAWTTPSVTVTLQLYDYNLGQYPTSGDGYILYTSSATSNTDETKSQTITTNPTHFHDGSGNWKIKVKGIKSTATQFDFKGDLIKFEVTYTPPIVKYYLTVNTDPEGIVPISGEGWYDNCTYVDLTAPLFVPAEAGVGGERSRFINWTVDGDFVSGSLITVYINANHTAVAHYVKQYKLIMSTNFGTASPSVGEHWYDVGSVVPISVTAPSVVDGEQYVWLGWTGTGTISYTGMNNPASATMNSPITETAAWRHEYRLTMATNYGTTSPSLGDHWYEAGSIVSLSATPPSTIDGERYVWNGWTGTGTISYTGMNNPAAVTMNSPITQTASWTHQYRLTMATNFGTTSPSVGEHWYDAGSIVAISAAPPSVIDGERYVWNGWTGTGTISYTGMDNPSSVTMNSPITETAAWRHEYRLTIATNYGTTSPSTGVHWYEVGTPVPIQAFAPSVITGEQYVWNGWTGTGTGSYTGTENPSSVTLNGPISETATWIHQFLLTIKTSGLPSAYPTNVYLVGLQVGIASDTSPYTKWFDAGASTGTIGVDSTVSAAAGTQYVFVQWVEDSSTSNPRASETMNLPKTFTAKYKTQYYLIVNTNPAEVLSLNPAAVSGQGWYDSGATATVDAVQNVDKVTGQSRYDFRFWTGATPTGVGNQATVLMNGPKTATANYQLQYYLNVTSLYGVTGGQGWYDSGATAYASLNSGTFDHGNGTRRLFTQWGGDASGTNYAQSNQITMSAPKTALANWKTQYLLTVVTDPSGLTPQPTRNPAGEAGPANGWWYDASTSVTLTAQSVTSYSFNRWDVDGSLKTIGENPISVNMNTRHTATAHYTQAITYTLAVTATASGATNPAQGTYTYSGGITVDVTATPSAGYRFDHWVLDGSNAGTVNHISVLMDKNHNLQAVFAETHTLTISVSQGGTTNPAAGTYTYQTPTDVSVTAIPNPNYYLDQWIYDGNDIGSQNTVTVHVGSSHTLEAIFKYAPVGGYSISLTKQAPTSPIAAYTMLIALFGAALSLIKRKRK